MKTKIVICGLLSVFFALALNGCAGSRKAKCSCPNFRGSRAIYGKADVKNQDVNSNSSEEVLLTDDFRLSTTTLWR